jgi:hypothetical protein
VRTPGRRRTRELTSQEAQIAGLARATASRTARSPRRLFLTRARSSGTSRRSSAKLGIASRRDLRARPPAKHAGRSVCPSATPRSVVRQRRARAWPYVVATGRPGSGTRRGSAMRDLMSSFVRLFMCTRPCAGLRNSFAPIWGFDRPSRASCAMCSSGASARHACRRRRGADASPVPRARAGRARRTPRVPCPPASSAPSAARRGRRSASLAAQPLAVQQMRAPCSACTASGRGGPMASR